MKNSLICADDFGLSEAINAGILALLAHRKISAVSCMTNEQYWDVDAEKLKAFSFEAKIGLHFNLPYQSLGVFILKTYLGLIKTDDIQKALETQFSLFVEKMGKKPDFLDGHQHIHQLPGIREVVIAFYKKHYPEKAAFIRNTYNQQPLLKAKIINLLGGKALKGLLTQEHIPHNAVFSGIYDLSPQANYADLLKGFLADIDTGGLMMCHPALPTQNLPDTEKFRANEFQVLMIK